MGTKIKGIYKGFKYISKIFVVKEREMEIGYPTDVKHVAHIGWDGASGSEPSWMGEFKSPPDFSTTAALGNTGDMNSVAFSSWSSEGTDYDHISERRVPASDVLVDVPPSDRPNVTKKSKRKKKMAASSPKSCSSTRSSRASKMKASYHDIQSAANIQV
ncbi:hypothetical protein K2173_005604 [Erythroxylum novogranatense]|uniref:CRIB domain-containing protein n=1 Tax=Erythroxylum novogranatense TaxID=1862640 RepID=A0AAV8T5P0_9ROSI|nr:hypothetical protein K2173_005604 [Erythroxylum novogranatense]